MPKTLQGAVSTPSSNADAGVTVRTRAEYMKDHRTKGQSSKTSIEDQNEMLHALAMERASRAKQQKGGGMCPLYPVVLTQVQKDELASLQLVQEILQQDDDYEDDVDLARRLQREENAEFEEFGVETDRTLRTRLERQHAREQAEEDAELELFMDDEY